MSNEKIKLLMVTTLMLLPPVAANAKGVKLVMPTVGATNIAEAKSLLLKFYSKRFLSNVPIYYKQLSETHKGTLAIEKTRLLQLMMRLKMRWDNKNKTAIMSPDVFANPELYSGQPRHDDKRRFKDPSFLGVIKDANINPDNETFGFAKDMSNLLACDTILAKNTKYPDEFMRLWLVMNLKIKGYKIDKKSGKMKLEIDTDSNAQFGCEMFKAKGKKLYGSWPVVLYTRLNYEYDKGPRPVIEITLSPDALKKLKKK